MEGDGMEGDGMEGDGMEGDGMEGNGDLRTRAAFSLITGGLYLLFGSLQLVADLGLGGGWSDDLSLGGAAMDGAIMVIIGLVFLTGHRELRAGLHEGVAFVYVGILLALFFLLVQLTQISASYLGSITLGGDWADYSAADTVSPFLYLSPLPLAGLMAWKGGFTLRPRGVPQGNGASLINVEED